MPEPTSDPASGSSPDCQSPRIGTVVQSDSPPLDENGVSHAQPLKLVTSFPSPSCRYPSMSMLPTPIVPPAHEQFPLPQTSSPPELSAQSSTRIFSSSLIPDDKSSLQSPASTRSVNQDNEEMTTRPIKLPLAMPDLGRSGSLVVPKRGERAAQLTRSGSVGSPQRQPTTVLHREREVSFIPGPESVPEQVYVANSTTDKRTAWKRVKFLGKGSFSEIVLAQPASDYVRPDLRSSVEAEAARELALLDDAATRRDVPPLKLLVAVKITAIKDTGDPQLQAFNRDVELMTTLPKHPSVLRMFGSSLDIKVHHRSIFVLPYCSGGDLFDLVAKNRSSLSSLLVRRLFADICSAVAFLHANLVVHRDIKLENVLLDVPVARLLKLERPDQVMTPLAKVTDLGLARRIDAEQPLLTTRCGSDDYVPPELLLGQPYDGRETDTWALGVLLYAILEGRLPFDTPPNSMPEGARARLRSAHRIARVDWNWYKRRECADEWLGGKEIVDNTLVRRKQRYTASDLLKMPWVADALPKRVEDLFDSHDILELFMQQDNR